MGDGRPADRDINDVNDCCTDDYKVPRESLVGSRRSSEGDIRVSNPSPNEGHSQFTDDWRTVESNCCGSQCNKRLVIPRDSMKKKMLGPQVSLSLEHAHDSRSNYSDRRIT